MFTKIALPLVALLGIVVGVGAVYTTAKKDKESPVSVPLLDPPQKPARIVPRDLRPGAGRGSAREYTDRHGGSGGGPGGFR